MFIFIEVFVVEINFELLVCEGEIVMVGDMDFDVIGIYEVVLNGVVGCDFIVNLVLMVFLNDLVIEMVEICDGEIYIWEGMMLSEFGQYQLVYINVQGCDSIWVFDLGVFFNFELFIVDILLDNGSGNGVVVLDVFQGQLLFSVSWSNGGVGLVQIGLLVGNYMVMVMDGNDCLDIFLVMVLMMMSLCEVGL